MSKSGTNQFVRDNEKKEEKPEQQQSGFGAYLIGGLFGVAAGIAAATYFSERKVPQETGPQARHGGNCAYCLDTTTPNVVTPCCQQLLHRDCYIQGREHGERKCPYCRSRW